MTEDEFLDTALAPVRKNAPERTVQDAKLFLQTMNRIPLPPDYFAIIGSMAPNHVFSLAVEGEFEITEESDKILKDLDTLQVAAVAASAAQKFAKRHDGVISQEVNSTRELNILLDVLFTLYLRSKGDFVPRPGKVLRMALITFLNFQSDESSVFVAYWNNA
jgi:hypothetical protein